jgi:hypothetical protein
MYFQILDNLRRTTIDKRLFYRKSRSTVSGNPGEQCPIFWPFSARFREVWNKTPTERQRPVRNTTGRPVAQSILQRFRIALAKRCICSNGMLLGCSANKSTKRQTTPLRNASAPVQRYLYPSLARSHPGCR